MSYDEVPWEWIEFKKIGDTIHKLGMNARVGRAQDAMLLAEELRKTRFILSSQELHEQYSTIFLKICSYLDNNLQVIQAATRAYFILQHCKAGLSEDRFKLTVYPKKSGIQVGFTCDVFDGIQTARFFIKTHQYGPTNDNPRSVKPPDSKEIFVYKLLFNLGIGPEVHFIVPIHGSNMTIYIATRECELTLLSQLVDDSLNTKSLVQLDLISRVLCLCDCTTNSSNCGIVYGKPMVVDFRIETRCEGYVQSDIVHNFFAGNGEYKYTGVMASAMGIPQEYKLSILKESLLEWDLLDTIGRTFLEVQRSIGKLVEVIRVDDELKRYVADVKASIKLLSQL